MNKRLLIRAAVFVAAALLVLAAALILLDWADRNEEKRDNMTEGFGQLRTVEWKGATYREKPAVTTLLIAGIDKTEEADDPTGRLKYRSGGQADFLLILAIDHSEKKIHQLQIDRDTITDVTTLGVFGNETGSRKMQICLAHAFGETPQDNAAYTIRAVQNLLGGLEIDGYYMFDYSAVPVINDALGGVTVTIPDDMTSVHPEWVQGTKVTLYGKDAESFVRSRRTVGSGTNKERMDRQNQYMRNAISRMNEKISDDLNFAESILGQMQELAVTNMTVKRLAEEINKSYQYEILDVDRLPGEYGVGDTGLVEFYMQDDAAVEWVLEHLYTKL